MLKLNKILTIFLAIQVLFVFWIKKHPSLIESFYSNGLYPKIASFLRMVFGVFPFSVGDVLYVIFGLWVLRSLYRLFKNKAKNWQFIFFNLTAKISIFYFIFHLFWGFNYYRKSLNEQLEVVIPKYNVEELNLMTEKLLIKLQEVHFLITKSDTLAVHPKFSKSELLKKSETAYTNLQKNIPQLTYTSQTVKKSLFSLPLTYMGFSGYLNPFTNEAQVNYKIPKFYLPIVATHEIAHQIGYANESEANFIGYLAAVQSEDVLFQYTAYLMAFRYCLSELYVSEKAVYFEIYGRIPKGILKNFKESQKFWKSYKNPLEPIFKKMYDLFLKSNNQHHGINSYSKMVGLIMAFDKNEKYKNLLMYKTD